VSGALVAIVLVLCAVFIPVAFLGGITGAMFQQFAITIVVSVILSGIVALTLTPALCAILIKPHDPNHQKWIFFRKFNEVFDRITGTYVGAVGGVVAAVFDAGRGVFVLLPTFLGISLCTGAAIGVAADQLLARLHAAGA